MTRPKRSHGQGSKVRRRKDGRFTASVMYSGHRYSVYGRTATEAGAKLKALRLAHDRGDPLRTPRATVGEYLAAWLDGVGPTLRPQTLERYRYAAERHLIPELGPIRLAHLSAADVRAFYAARTGQLAPATIGFCGAVLRLALAVAVRDGLLSRNVAGEAAPPRQEPRERPTLDGDQAARFFAAAAAGPHAALFALLLGSGLRLGEALALHWRDVDLDGGVLTVRSHLVRVGNALAVVPGTKTNRPRVVPLSALARSALLLQRGEEATPPEQLVVPDEDGRPLPPQRVRYHFGQALAAAGLPHMRLHDLRHSVATLLGAEGQSPRAVADLLGHRRVSMTLDTYTHGSEQLARQAAAALDRLLPGALLGPPAGGLGSELGSS